MRHRTFAQVGAVGPIVSPIGTLRYAIALEQDRLAATLERTTGAILRRGLAPIWRRRGWLALALSLDHGLRSSAVERALCTFHRKLAELGPETLALTKFLRRGH
jgi:hypothetical protein